MTRGFSITPVDERCRSLPEEASMPHPRPLLRRAPPARRRAASDSRAAISSPLGGGFRRKRLLQSPLSEGKNKCRGRRPFDRKILQTAFRVSDEQVDLCKWDEGGLVGPQQAMQGWMNKDVMVRVSSEIHRKEKQWGLCSAIGVSRKVYNTEVAMKMAVRLYRKQR
ncbi:unnamed protein product [Victoria cruziana]